MITYDTLSSFNYPLTQDILTRVLCLYSLIVGSSKMNLYCIIISKVDKIPNLIIPVHVEFGYQLPGWEREKSDNLFYSV